MLRLSAGVDLLTRPPKPLSVISTLTPLLVFREEAKCFVSSRVRVKVNFMKGGSLFWTSMVALFDGNSHFWVNNINFWFYQFV